MSIRNAKSVAGLVMIATIISLGAYQAQATEAISGFSDGTFEHAKVGPLPTGWQIGKHYGRVSAGATFGVDASGHGGGRCLKIMRVDGKMPAICMTKLIDIEAGATYRLSAYMKGDAKQTAVRMFVVPNNFKQIATASLKLSDHWERYDLTFKAPATDVRPVNIRFDIMEPGTARIDDVTFTKTKAGTGKMSDAGAYRPATSVTDGTFEKADVGKLPDGWKIGKHYGQVPTGATFVVDETVAHDGKQSVRVTSPSKQGIPAILMSNPVVVEPGQAYVITAYMKSKVPNAEAGILALRSDYKGAERSTVILSDQWRRYRVVFKAANKAPGYVARFDLGQDTTWIDDVSITKLADADRTGPALGYRYAETPGSNQVTLTVGEPTGRKLKSISGVCYCYGFGLREFPPKWADTKLKVVRIHNVLSGLKILRKKPKGGFDYDYTLLDKAIDEILTTGAVPEMSLCFVPIDMVEKPDPKLIRGKYYRGQPSDYGQWEEYIYNVVKHCSERYPNVDQWFWVFGNEPGVRQFSMGTKDEYYRLYKHTLAGAVRANPNIRIGAGSFAHHDWLKDFVARCAAESTRMDVLAWHHYNIVPEDYAVLIDRVRHVLSKYPAYANVTLAIDEWNPILPDFRPAHFSAGNYGAAHAVASIYSMMKSGLNYQTLFISSSPHGWGMTGRKGIKQPTFNAFEMLGMLGTEELGMTVPNNEPYVGGFATRKSDGTITVMVWYVKSRNDISPEADKTVTVRLPHIAPSAAVTRYLIDRRHSNSQFDPKRADLEAVPASLQPGDGGKGSKIQFDACPNSVSLLIIKPQ